jgi:hypothetical protein
MKISIKTYAIVFFSLMAAVFGCLNPQSARATTNAYFAAVNGLYGGGADNSSLNMGHSFTITNTSLQISALGVYDFGGDGLNASHLVGIFTDEGNTSPPVPNASVTVPAGTNAPLINGYRYQALPSPVILGPGTYYVVAFQMNGYAHGSDPYSDNNNPTDSNNGFNSIPGVTDNGSVFESNPNQGPDFSVGGSAPYTSTNDFGSASFLYDAGLIANVTPAATFALAGQPVTLTATATGETPIYFQWYFTNSTPGYPVTLLDGQTNSTLTIESLDTNSAGNYWVMVSNVFGTATSGVANVTLVYPPSIVSQPAGTNISEFGTATLSVTASGTGPLYYQWSMCSTNLANATNSTLVLTNFKTLQASAYSVTISNAYGQVTSSNAPVEVLPTLTTAFKGASGFWGQPTTLTVDAIGSGNLQYQWYYDGTAVAGATNSVLTFESTQFTNAGQYSVVVSSQYGSVSNAAAQVVVNPAGLSLAFNPSLTITGVVGYTYIIQSSTDLSSPSNWVTLTNLTLTNAIQIFTDTSVNASSPYVTKYFYQILPGQ